MPSTAPIPSAPIADAADLASVRTLPQLLERRLRATPSGEAYRAFDAAAGDWRSLTWREFGQEVRRRRLALTAEGFAKGDRVAILAPSGIEHVALDQAVLAQGLVPVPMHALDNSESIVYILQDSAAVALIVDSVERWRAIAAAGDIGTSLKRVISIAAAPGATGDGRLVALDAWLSAANGGQSEPLAPPIDPNDLAALVYTSGTTGRPKGVMLSHANILANIKATAERLHAESADVFLSFLPLSHTLERTCGYYFPIAAGSAVAFSRSVKLLADDFKATRPTVVVSVPRIYERFYAAIMERRAALKPPQRALFDLALAVGLRRYEARRCGKAPSAADRALWPALDRLVAAPVRAQFGGRLRIAFTGGAPIGQAVIRLFLALGLDILQGYGMTELSPVVSVNAPDDNDERSVGRPLPGVEVKLGENQELLVRGPNAMVGYWNRPEDTRRVKEPDGWLHTGDQARIEDGRIYITGRIKEIIVTSTGEKVSPGDLETAILADTLFANAMVLGENRPYLAVVAALDPEIWAREKRALADDAKPGAKKAQADFLLQRIRQAVKTFPAYATPRAVAWTTEPWTVESTLVTPTLKNKRLNIEARFADEIEGLYARKPAG
jgi:long-chain acyl-CoA synthetase